MFSHSVFLNKKKPSLVSLGPHFGRIQSDTRGLRGAFVSGRATSSESRRWQNARPPTMAWRPCCCTVTQRNKKFNKITWKGNAKVQVLVFLSANFLFFYPPSLSTFSLIFVPLFSCKAFDDVCNGSGRWLEGIDDVEKCLFRSVFFSLSPSFFFVSPFRLKGEGQQVSPFPARPSGRPNFTDLICGCRRKSSVDSTSKPVKLSWKKTAKKRPHMESSLLKQVHFYQIWFNELYF